VYGVQAPIGLSDFKALREPDGRYSYVDKSQLIVDLLESGASVTLFTRPRRFGKTLNLSMIVDWMPGSGTPTTQS